jgi:ABC-2 type transport system permease protein
MYHIRATLATTRRVLRQLGHDHRSLALIFVVPCLLLGLLKWLYSDNTATFTFIAPALLAIFPFVIMFIITSITTLRERTTGTLERLMALPIAKLDLVVGYMLAFGFLASIQALLASLVLLYGLGLDVAGPHWLIVLIALGDALLGTALGIFVSAFARTEFQAVQFMPALIFPQILIGGLLIPLEQMPGALEAIARCLPLTYAIDGLKSVALQQVVAAEVWRDLLVVAGFILAAIVFAAATLRRRTR